MIELYSIRDVSKILAVQESRLRYWMQTGFVGPTVRKNARFYYTFSDLVAVKSAKDLLAAGLPLQKVRKNLEALRKTLPGDANPAARLRVCSDGETLVALAADVAFQPMSGQIVMAFELPVLGERIAEVLALPEPGAAASPSQLAAIAEPAVDDAVPGEIAFESTDAHGGSTAYRYFMEACAAEDRGEYQLAEHLLRQALDLEPTMAAALTNLGNLMYGSGKLEEARGYYERAIEHDPGLPEARYNLANVLEDLGDAERAIAELRQVCVTAPDFADAHYNLGVMLAKVGGTEQAREYLARYVELDPQSAWAEHARSFLVVAA